MKSNIIYDWKAFAPYVASMLRIVAAVMFITSGTMKLFAFPKGVPPDNGTVEFFTQAGIGGFIEVVGGFLVLIGLFTRPVAFILAGEMAVAYFQFHLDKNFWPLINNGTNAVLYCFVWLYFSAAGAGPWSFDALIRKKKLKGGNNVPQY